MHVRKLAEFVTIKYPPISEEGLPSSLGGEKRNRSSLGHLGIPLGNEDALRELRYQ